MIFDIDFEPLNRREADHALPVKRTSAAAPTGDKADRNSASNAESFMQESPEFAHFVSLASQQVASTPSVPLADKSTLALAV
jgi:hypothetical protein